jgi:hypothetical protein
VNQQTVNQASSSIWIRSIRQEKKEEKISSLLSCQFIAPGRKRKRKTHPSVTNHQFIGVYGPLSQLQPNRPVAQVNKA